MGSNDNPRKIMGVSAATSGVTVPNGGVVPVEVVFSKPAAPILKHRVRLPGLEFSVTAAAGGAADAQSQKLLTLPQGRWLVLASRPDFTSVTSAGCSVASAVFSVGHVAAAADNATLSGDEASVIVSHTLGDGTLAAATAQSDQNIWIGPDATTAIVGIVGSTTADTDLFFSVGGTFTHATLTACTVTVTGTIELTLMDLGDL